MHLPGFVNNKSTLRLTGERVAAIIAHIAPGFLTKTEVDLLAYILFQYEKVIAFTDAKCGTFNWKYYPDYIM
jgi:hypothetical protein